MTGRGWVELLRRWRALLLDVLLWAALSAPVAWALISPPHEPWYGWRLAGSLLLLGVAVVTSRRHPLASLLLVVVPTMADGNFAFAVPVMSYLAGLRMTRARPAALAFAAIALAGTPVSVGLLGTNGPTWFFLAATLLYAGVFPWLIGRYHRQHRALVMAGWEQAALVEREQRGAAERVRMRERARIAQDMHDSLGHELSLIALRAGALEVAAELDERHRRAAGELRASVAAATERLREITGVLREDADRVPTQPADEGVAELVERARDAGMAVRLLRDGATGPSPAMVGRAVHRVVQEALTNAARHAPGAAVIVRVASSAEQTEVSVVNDRPPAGPLPAAPAPAPRAAGPSGGSGLVGLRERVRLAGGTLRAGPRDGGFEVSARLPHAAGSVAPDPHEPASGALSSAHRLRDARQRVRRSLLVAVAAPVAIATALSLVYYPFAAFDAVLERTEFDRIRIGQERGELAGILPARQARARPAVESSTPAGAGCEFYTDGNFPLAEPTYRLCFLDGRLVAKDVLSG